MGLPVDGAMARALGPLLARATRRFSRLFAECDRIMAEQGLIGGSGWLLTQLVRGYRVVGAESIPPGGPLVIASNHPGTVDSLLLSASAGRPDMKIVAGAIPFLQHLPHVSRYLLYTSYSDVHSRMIVVRESIRHLRGGGALLLFARAGIDPDPAFMPEAERELGLWSRSLEIFVASVPQTQVLASIVSGVIDPRYMRHPLTWLKRTREDRQRLAMMMQIIEQMLGRQLDLLPQVTFGEPLNLRSIGSTEQALESVVRSAHRVLHAAMEPV